MNASMDKQSISRKTELENCRFIKVILMLLIIMVHSANFWTGTWFTKNPVIECRYLCLFTNWISTFHKYGFVLVSGYIFSFIKYERGGYTEFIPFLNNKIKRLIIPFIFVSAIWVIPLTSNFLPVNIIKDFVLAESPSQLWFLWMLFDVFIVFWLLSDFFIATQQLDF